MGFQSLRSMAYDDDEMLDRMIGPDFTPPEHPPGLMFSISKDDLEKAGAVGGDPDDTMRFSAMCEVTSVFRGRQDCRIELEMTMFAGEDGKFFDLSQPAHICLCGPELEKLELDDDAERGDMIHLIGTARMGSSSDTEWGGQTTMLQITELTCEDESNEAREG